MPKAYFIRWFQQAWQQTTTSRQIRSAWANAHLYPLGEVNDGRPITPPRSIPLSQDLETPHTSQAIQVIDRRLRRNEISPRKAYEKTQKALEQALAEKVLLEKDLERREAAETLDRATRGSQKRQRFLQGHLFDSEYAERHAQELAERKIQENERRGARWQGARPEGQLGAPESVDRPLIGLSEPIEDD